uniref:ADP-ribosyl cyclase/cyclic ADP-ribose hydrolase n=1 Tax=Cyprinodon variegatus TaxID=28743 RepID=A0A3Q2D6X0_CYPVA
IRCRTKGESKAYEIGFKTNFAITAGVLIVAILIVVPLAVLLSPRTAQFRATFRKKCQAFPETSQRCEDILRTFEEAYFGKDSCNFPEEAYHQLFVKNPFIHSCYKTMFWSGTKDLVHQFTEKRDNFITLEGTLLGHIMNDLTWCGRKGTQETFIYFCEECKMNPVSAFWVRASAEFANYSCGHASVMLNGEISKPFDPTSYFGSIEVRKLMYPRVQSLTVILVTKNNNVDCSHESLQVLRNILDPEISLYCHSVKE